MISGMGGGGGGGGQKIKTPSLMSYVTAGWIAQAYLGAFLYNE